MAKLTVDEETCEALAARIDDENPSLEHLARTILLNTAKSWDETLGYKPPAPCACGHLQDMVEDPGFPLEFDRETNEFHLVGQSDHGKPYSLVRSCPWCGRPAPKSTRNQLFERVSPLEAARLARLCEGLARWRTQFEFSAPQISTRRRA